MGDRLATIDMGRKVRAAVPLSVGSWVEAYLHIPYQMESSYPSSRLFTIDMDRKVGAAVPLSEGEGWVAI